MARNLLDKQNVRIISFSTGTNKKHEQFTKTDLSKLDLLGLTSEFMMEIEIFNTNNLLEKYMEEDLK